MDLQSFRVEDSGMNNGNAGGTYPYVYIAKHDDVDGLELNPFPMDPENIAEIDFMGVYISALSKVAITEQTGKVTDELIGETDGKSFSHTLSFHIAGSASTNLGLAAATKNARLVLFIAEEDGKIRIVGNTVNPARFESYTQDTGGTREERKGGTYTFKSFGNSPAPTMVNGSSADLDMLIPLLNPPPPTNPLTPPTTPPTP